ncbi:EKC/KEOPS complex subunit BUD32 [Fusarium oxysporum f. sp. albedinis]|nr:EKC/KEOPS complex subunit BUD32 [Fusarium oxysporum f. sp. albedinis]
MALPRQISAHFVVLIELPILAVAQRTSSRRCTNSSSLNLCDCSLSSRPRNQMPLRFKSASVVGVEPPDLRSPIPARRYHLTRH